MSKTPVEQEAEWLAGVIRELESGESSQDEALTMAPLRAPAEEKKEPRDAFYAQPNTIVRRSSYTHRSGTQPRLSSIGEDDPVLHKEATAAEAHRANVGDLAARKPESVARNPTAHVGMQEAVRLNDIIGPSLSCHVLTDQPLDIPLRGLPPSRGRVQLSALHHPVFRIPEQTYEGTDPHNSQAPLLPQGDSQPHRFRFQAGDVLTPPPSPTAPGDEREERFVVASTLGEGSWGVVYRAYAVPYLLSDPPLSRYSLASSDEKYEEVAIKVVPTHLVSGKDTGIALEHRILKQNTVTGQRFACGLLRSWADVNNVYLVMVRLFLLRTN